MASMKAKIEIGLDTSKIKSGSKEATQSFDKMASGAKSAMGKVDARANSTGNAIKQVGTEGKIAGSKVKAGAEKGAQGMNKLGAEAKKAERDIGGVAISVLGLGASITGLSDTIFGMQEKMVALERSTFGLERTTEDVKRMQEDFDKAVASGTMTAEEHARAVKDLELAYKDMAIEQKEVKAEQEAMNSEWISFAVNTATTVVFSLTTITTALGAERSAKIASALATNILNLSMKGLVKTLWAIARHPVFLVATAGLAIWESNLFGLRSEVEKWAGMDLGIFSNIENMLGTGIPEASAETAEEFENLDRQITTLQDTLQNTTNAVNIGVAPALHQVGKEAQEAGDKVNRLNEQLDEFSKKNENSNAITSRTPRSQIPNTALMTSQERKQHNLDQFRGLGGRGASAIAHVGGNATQHFQRAVSTPRHIIEEARRKDAIENARRERVKALGRKKHAENLAFQARWGLSAPRYGWKAWYRGTDLRVNRIKGRLEKLKRFGVDVSGIRGMPALERAEAENLARQTKLSEQAGTSVLQIQQWELGGVTHHIFNMINYRERLGLISSGVI